MNVPENYPPNPSGHPLSPGTRGLSSLATLNSQPSTPAKTAHPSALKQTLTFALLALLVAVLRYPLLALGTHTLFDLDWSIFCQPVAEYNKSQILSGELPTWCPWLHNGVPWLAQWNTLLCYPGILFYLLLPTNWGLNLFQIFHMAFGSMGMYLLARQINGGNHFGAAIMGLSYELNGVCLSVLNWPQNLSNYSWVPWVILLQLRAIRALSLYSNFSASLQKSELPDVLPSNHQIPIRSLSHNQPVTFSIALAGLATALHLLTGLPEFNVIAWTFSLALGVAETCGETKLWRPITAWFASICLGFAVAAVQILPAAILVATNDDPTRGRANAEWALNSSGLINFIHPMYDTVRGQFADKPFTQIWMPVHYTNLGLTSLAMVMAWKLRRLKIVWAIVAVGLAWTLLAGGWTDPLSGPIIQHIPVISRMRYPIKFVLGSVLALHLLAALFWRERNPQHVRLALCWTLLLPISALGLAWIFRLLSQAPDRGLHLGPFVIHIACGLSLLALLLYRNNLLKRLVLLGGGSALLLLNSFLATREPNPQVRVEAYTGTPIRDYCATNTLPIPAPIEGRLRPERGGWKTQTPEEFVYLRRVKGMGNTTLIEGLNNTGGFVSVASRWQDLWTLQLESALSGSPDATAEPMLDFTAVRFTAGTSGAAWVTRTNAMPLISIGQTPRVIPDQKEALTFLASTNWNPRKTFVLSAQLAPNLFPDPSPRNVQLNETASPNPQENAQNQEFAQTAPTAFLKTLQAKYWQIETQASQPTFLVISQTWYPGWSASVNGNPTELLRANIAFQAIAVPAGKSVVELYYREPGFRLGAAISALTLLTCLAVTVPWRTRGSLLNTTHD